jgi:hypothetical protein
MPTPNDGESRDDFMDRCIPQVISEGKEQDQAVAICSSLYEQESEEKMALETTFSYEEMAGKAESYLLVKGKAITEGTHNGKTWTKDVIKTLVPKMKNAPLLVEHRQDGQFRNRGKVVNSEWINEELILTSMVTDPEAIKMIKNGDLHSYSIRVLARHTLDGLVKGVVGDAAEVTLTGYPVDPNANFMNTKEILVNVAMAGKNQDTPPVTEATQISQQGGNCLSEDTEKKTEQTTEPVASGTDEVTEVKLAQQNEKILEQDKELKELRSTVELMSRAARAKDITSDVKSWVKNNNLPPAAEEKTRDLLMKLNDDDVKLFSEIITMNELKPFGGVELGEGAGKVKDPEVESKPDPTGIDWDNMDTDVFETLLNSYAIDQLESNGIFGQEAAKKHLRGYMMNLRGEQ